MFERNPHCQEYEVKNAEKKENESKMEEGIENKGNSKKMLNREIKELQWEKERVNTRNSKEESLRRKENKAKMQENYDKKLKKMLSG